MNPAVFIGCCNPPKVGADLIGCGGKVGCVVGAEALADNDGVWVKTHFQRQGPFLCATVYSVKAGEPRVFELRVDIRPIARALMRAHAAAHAVEMAKASVRGTTIGWGLGDLWKGAKSVAKKVGRSKLVKGVAGAVSSVARNPIAQALNPALAISAHTMSRAAGGKGVLKGALGSVVDRGSGLATAAAGGGASVAPLVSRLSSSTLGAFNAANQALAGVEAGRRVVQVAQQAQSTIAQGRQLARVVQATNQRTAAAVKTAGALMPANVKSAIASRVKAAGTLALNAKGRAAVASTLARVPASARDKVAASLAGKLKGLAALRSRAALVKSLPPTAGAAVAHATRLQVQAGPLLQRAASTAKKLQSPLVQRKLAVTRTQGQKAEELLRRVAIKAEGGSLDGKKSATIVNLVARNRARIQALAQANAGGVPGLLITKDGKIKRGRFRIEAVAKQNGVLYTGPGKATERGQYQTVSGDIELDSIAVQGDLPIDGVRLSGRGANSYELGVYEVEGVPRALVGCGQDSRCAPCAANA